MVYNMNNKNAKMKLYVIFTINNEFKWHSYIKNIQMLKEC